MTANIGTRLRKGDVWAIITPTEGNTWAIEVRDLANRPVPKGTPEYKAALEEALLWVSRLRAQLFDLLDRKIPTPSGSSER